MGTKLLEVKSLRKDFGGILAVNDVSFDVSEGQIKAIIGPNGAGKTTIFNVISRIYSPTHGKIFFGGEDITNIKIHKVPAHGIIRTFQNIRLFSNMSVLENVMVGYHTHTKANLWQSVFRSKYFQQEEKEIEEKACQALEIVGLSDCRDISATTLPFGRQRMVEIARAIVSKPKMILLDEPAAGLNSNETEELAELVKKINELGITILVIEHDMGFVMGISDEIVVIDYGQNIAEGTPREIQNNEKVIKAYLGSE